MWLLAAQLTNAGGSQVATGYEHILVVDWKDSRLAGKGAIYEAGSAVHDFLKSRMGLDVPAYTDELGPLDWLLVARAPNEEPVNIPTAALQTPEKTAHGLRATFYSGKGFAQKLSERVDSHVDFASGEGASPDPAVAAGLAIQRALGGAARAAPYR